MQQINDLIFQKLSAFEGSVDDKINSWLANETGQQGDTADLWTLMFQQAGIDTQRNDAAYAWLELQGHTEPALGDRWYTYWSSPF